MAYLFHRVFFLITGLMWAWLWIIRALVDLIRLGPRKVFHKSNPQAPPSQLEDPVYGEHNYINIGPVKLHYVISGPQDGPLMLMLHGFPEIWYSWRYQIKEFQKDFRVVAVDMRGFGASDKPQGINQYKMSVLIEDIRLLIEALDYKSCVLLSHDWGGGVAWAFAANHPNMVDRLVVMNIPPVPIWKRGFTSPNKPIQFLASGYIYFFLLPFLPEFLAGLNDGKLLDMAFLGKQFGVRSGRMTTEDVECYKFYFRKSGALTSAINYYRANLGVPGTTHSLQYPVPVKIIWGCKDVALTLTVLEDTCRAIPQCDVTRIEEASHWVQMDQPEKVSQSIREFLQSTNYSTHK